MLFFPFYTTFFYPTILSSIEIFRKIFDILKDIPDSFEYSVKMAGGW